MTVATGLRRMRGLVPALGPGPPGGWVGLTRTVPFDVAVALAATGVEIGLLFDDAHTANLPAVLLAVAAGTALLARSRHPVPVLAATLAAVWALVALDQAPGGAAALVALFTVAHTRELRASALALVPTAVLLQVWSVASPPVAVLAWSLGVYAQTRRRYVDGLRRRAADLERERTQLARIAVYEERASIARELHDIVAHSVTVMLIGVRGARDVLRIQPEVADETLARVEASGEHSLVELRRVLALLRDPERVPEPRPQPSLTDLADLVSGFRAAGMPVVLQVAGAHQRLTDGAELSVFRIVQEALTNVVKHADPTRVTVALSFHPSHLDVEVVDDGPAPHDATASSERGTTGHGLVGMRERVALLGGEFTAGPRAGGGFRVAARLPAGTGQ